jgi:spermidine synthase
VQPWAIVDRARAPGGAELQLARRGDEWVVRAGGRVIMSSRMHGSEEALAALALRRLERPRKVLIGGLGLGFTLRAALDRLPSETRVVVAELSPELAAWNRGPVSHLAGRPLDDPRVRLQIGDVAGRIAEAKGAFDAILLDVDNGPSPAVRTENRSLYGAPGVRACLEALRPGGVLAVWSAGPDERYLERLERAGLRARAEAVPVRAGGGARHVVFLGFKAGPGPGPARRGEPRAAAIRRAPGPRRPTRRGWRGGRPAASWSKG